jgi:hypothetical protein
LKVYKKGLTVEQLIVQLSELPKNAQFYVSSDEEENLIFEGFFLKYYDNNCVVIAGLSGTELPE